MANGSFQEVIDDPKAKVSNIDTVVLCSGKFYYEASEKATEMGADNMAFVRVEQLYPLPEAQIRATINKYKGAKNIIWAQEEPANMGAWAHMAMNLPDLGLIGVSRKASAASAEGSSALHKKRLNRLFEDLFKYAKVAVK